MQRRRASESIADPCTSFDTDLQLFVGHRLGRGGLATVERGWDPLVRRDVAVKRAHHPERQRAVDALRHEADVLHRLNHPVIVGCHRLVEDPNLGPLLVLERVDGRTWNQFAQRRGKPRQCHRAALRVALQVCDALEHAHTRGILHLDVKPSNVLVDNSGTARLIDWSIAHDLRGEVERQRVVGTPGYIAPEMVRPNRHAVSPQTDVYLLGATLYGILFGRAPHKAPDRQASLRSALLPVVLPPGLPASVEVVLSRALAVDPADRYASAAEFAHALETASEHSSSGDERDQSDPLPWWAVTGLAAAAAMACWWAAVT